MNETPLDLYLRAHTVVLDQAKRRSRRKTTTAVFTFPKWPDYAVVFGCESRTGITQELTFGFYRVLKLNGDAYVLEEEGGFFDDDLPLDVGAHQKTRFFGRAPSWIRRRRVRPRCLTRLYSSTHSLG